MCTWAPFKISNAWICDSFLIQKFSCNVFQQHLNITKKKSCSQIGTLLAVFLRPENYIFSGNYRKIMVQLRTGANSKTAFPYCLKQCCHVWKFMKKYSVGLSESFSGPPKRRGFFFVFFYWKFLTRNVRLLLYFGGEVPPAPV